MPCGSASPGARTKHPWAHVLKDGVATVGPLDKLHPNSPDKIAKAPAVKNAGHGAKEGGRIHYGKSKSGASAIGSEGRD